MTYASGNYYDGHWKFDKKSGYGEMHWLTTNEIYKGFWEENLQNGFGVHLWLEEAGHLKTMRNRYEGMWFNGFRNGYGTFYYSDGSRYDGEWVNNMKEGFAVFIDPSGDEMEAIFKNDRLFQRLNEPRKIAMTAIVPDASEESEDNLVKKKNSKGKLGRVSANTTTPNTRPQTKQGSRSRKLKSPPPEEALTKEQEFQKRNLENQVLNPYLQLLRVDDLLQTVRDKDEVLSQLQISLLHHNSTLMDVFKEYKAMRSNVNDLACTMTLESMWQFIRNSRIQSPVLSLANFDRYFYANPHNIFAMSYDFKDLRNKIKNLKLSNYQNNPRKLDVLKKLDVYIRNEEVTLTFEKLDYDNFDLSLKQVEFHHLKQFEEDQQEKVILDQMDYMNVKKFNVHDPQNIIQFRNFIDGLIRAIYIREDFNFENIGDDLSRKYIKLRIEPIVLNKNYIFDKPFASEVEELLKRFLQDYLIMNNQDVIGLFKKHLSNKLTFEVDVKQEVSDVRGLRELLQKANLIVTNQDELNFFKVVERYFDPDSSYLELLIKRVELNKHFNRMQTLELGGMSQHAESLEIDLSQHSPGLNDPKAPLSTGVLGPLAVPALPKTLDLNAQKDMGVGFSNIEEEDSKESKQLNNEKKQSNQPPTSLGQLNINLMKDVVMPKEEMKLLSKRLTALLGHELLYFEFVENLFLYLLVTVSFCFDSGQNQIGPGEFQENHQGIESRSSKNIQQGEGCQKEMAHNSGR